MEILVILALLLVNGMFAMYEFSLVSSSRARLGLLLQKGNQKVGKVLKLLKEPEKILSTIQVGITLIGIVSGALGGLTLAVKLTPYLEKIEFIRPYASNISVITVVGFITYFSLIIGELVPKSLAMNNPEKIAIILSPLMILLTHIFYPFAWFLSISTKFLNRLLGLKFSGGEAMNEDEIKYLLTYSSQQGMIEQEETQMIKEVFRFADKKAGELMTHRSEIIALSKNTTREDLLKTVAANKFSRYPLYGDTPDDIIGTVSVKDMLSLIDDKTHKFDLTDIVVPAIFIPENVLANTVLETFRKNKVNFGIVISEYGSVEGVITLHDLTEIILGDITGENEPDTLISKRDDGTFLVDGMMNIDDFMDTFGISSYEDIENEGFNTLSGLAMYVLNKIPDEGEAFHYKNLKFEIIDMDNSRVDKLLVTKEEIE
ncbi:MAG: hemolysin family protein [Prevotellaceae bacterium]|jgi:putative hemolysin|nr:hemolysin family protein [Prevotellaceae bacterium]